MQWKRQKASHARFQVTIITLAFTQSSRQVLGSLKEEINTAMKVFAVQRNGKPPRPSAPDAVLKVTPVTNADALVM